jgi:hypothetical protein
MTMHSRRRKLIHTILEHRLVVLSLYLSHIGVGESPEKPKLGTNLGRRIVIHKKCEGLTRDIRYPDIVEHLGIIERNFAGD